MAPPGTATQNATGSSPLMASAAPTTTAVKKAGY
jgi:hypothetical protein